MVNPKDESIIKTVYRAARQKTKTRKRYFELESTDWDVQLVDSLIGDNCLRQPGPVADCSVTDDFDDLACTSYMEMFEFLYVI